MPRTAPLIHIRVIGPSHLADRIITHLAEHLPGLLGPNHHARRTTRPTTWPPGHTRAYLTVSPSGGQHDY